jgi:methionyl-tRNA synthetase
MLLHPVMPERASLMWSQLGLENGIDGPWKTSLTWGGLHPGTQTRVGDVLFPRIELAATQT